MEETKTILLNVISNFIYAGLIAAFFWGQAKYKIRESRPVNSKPNSDHKKKLMPLVSAESPIQEPEEDIGPKAFGFLAYLFSAILIYFSVSAPVALKAAFNDGAVNLSDANHIGHLLPSIQITTEWFQWLFAVLVAILFLPIVGVADLEVA